ncbi:MAG: hypothetical protein ACREOU_04815 [Candidatus Eiseniibacteriota bacterium]
MNRMLSTLLVLGLAGSLAFAPGCAKKEETSGTSTDSTLSLGDFPQETSPAPESAYAPGPAETPAPEPAPPPAAKPKPRPKPTTPAPKPEPEPAPAPTAVVPAGTTLQITFPAEISTKDKVAGDTFTATLAEAITVDGKVVFPAGATINGHVVEAVRPGKTSGRGKMVLAYDSIEAGGTSYRIDSVGPPIEGKSGTGGDAAKIAGGAAAGAILGKIIGGSGSDAAKGAVIGGAAGTAASLATRGPDPKISAGQTITVTTDQAVTVSL